MRAEELSRFRAPVDAKAQQTALDAWERHGMRLITLGEAGLSAQLAFGGIAAGRVVCARRTSAGGHARDRDRRFACGEYLRPRDGLRGSRASSRPIFTIISGCALGIDSASHAAALNAGGRTIGGRGVWARHRLPVGEPRLARVPPPLRARRDGVAVPAGHTADARELSATQRGPRGHVARGGNRRGPPRAAVRSPPRATPPTMAAPCTPCPATRRASRAKAPTHSCVRARRSARVRRM
jgi:hypothetical protein